MRQTKAPLLHRVARWLGGLITVILAILLALPLILLPIATPVPVWAWGPLAIGDLAVLVLSLRFLQGWPRAGALLGGLLTVAILAVLTSQWMASTPAILGEDGKPLPGSIATLETVELNDSQQWISIRGENSGKPVLLFLAGGPGGSQLVAARRSLAELEKHFVVVNWEQPGSGKSFNAVPHSQLTPDRYIEDGRVLVDYLRQRFQQDRVYVLGESWGSALGIMMAQRYPELFHAFIGTGQMVAFLENDTVCYEWALNHAVEQGNSAKVTQLQKQGPPPYYGPGTALKESAFLMDTFNYMNANPAISGGGFNTFADLAGSEYGIWDKVNWLRGVIDTMDVVYPQLWEVDFRQSATHLEVPAYFLIGRHDINAPVYLTEAYYEMLDAPIKRLIWFEHSGHNPWVNEADAFVETVVNTVLAETWPQATD